MVLVCSHSSFTTLKVWQRSREIIPWYGLPCLGAGVWPLVLQHSRELREEVTRSLSTHRLPSRQMHHPAAWPPGRTIHERVADRQKRLSASLSACVPAQVDGWMHHRLGTLSLPPSLAR